MSTGNEELWVFPCHYVLKVMGDASDEFPELVASAVHRVIPGDYVPVVKPSRNGRFVSVNISFYCVSKLQLDEVYREVHRVDGVRMTL